ncbi:Rhomboid protease GlpG [BD1-7 clade bacterium]|uniref:Rhomboid protease GlpG n=1 Tax=BD1-7 clade bacterium TaxID=2029982 RepID=A0A5S9QM67_9GAMM|nr:Rhomboid protease GlpG [BD1-7 clade bacterium]CAA0115747.1 Rhomboid protease GlpG [BD1-7 clade bacterium]CAA0119440.1 Rhomboid protease GlpG [BD1-7 clade bacterium]
MSDLHEALIFEKSLDGQAIQHFVQYLQRAGFPHRLAEQGDKLVLYVYHPDHIEVVRSLFQRFADDDLPIIEVPPASASFNPVNILKTPVCLAVVLFCVAGFAAYLWSFWPLLQLFSFQVMQVTPAGVTLAPASESLANILHGQVWRLITPAFLHFSWAHIGFNLAIFWFLAQQLERFEGSLSLLSEVALLAVLSNVLQFYLKPDGLFGGLSGVVYGLMAYCWLAGKLNSEFKVFMPAGLLMVSVVMMIIGFTGVSSVFGFGIANWAHLGGFLAGLLLAFVRYGRLRQVSQ